MGLFGGGGEVGPTPQEQVLAQTFTQQWQDYQKRWLPIADHLGSVVSSMAPGKDSWQREEAMGKGNADTANAFAQDMDNRRAQLGAINAGSSRFKLGVASSAVAEAQSKGIAIESGNQQITSAYLKGLQSLTAAGSGLAGKATQGMSMAGELASHEAINYAQVQNAAQAEKLQAASFGIGAVGASMAGGIGGSQGLGSIMGGMDQNASEAMSNVNQDIGKYMNNGAMNIATDGSTLPLPDINIGR